MVSQVKKETMRACLSCPLCDSILLDATTISECLHTFCRKCIYEKITEDEIESCPLCNIDLGGTPLDKLRPDHNLQDLRTKIFPLKGRKVKAPEPARRKERSMSCLVVATPKVSRSEVFSSRENKDTDEPWVPKLGWKPLNFLVEMANKTKPLKSFASQGSKQDKQFQGKKPKLRNTRTNINVRMKRVTMVVVIIQHHKLLLLKNCLGLSAEGLPLPLVILEIHHN